MAREDYTWMPRLPKASDFEGVERVPFVQPKSAVEQVRGVLSEIRLPRESDYAKPAVADAQTGSPRAPAAPPVVAASAPTVAPVAGSVIETRRPITPIDTMAARESKFRPGVVPVSPASVAKVATPAAKVAQTPPPVAQQTPPIVSGAADASDYGADSSGKPVYRYNRAGAERKIPNYGAYDMEMRSPAAIRLAQQMQEQRDYDRMFQQFGGRRLDPNSVEAMQNRARWREAGRAALLGGMSPALRAQFEQQERQRAVQEGEMFKNSPEYIAKELEGRTAIGVAEAGSRGKMADIQVKLAEIAQDKQLSDAERASRMESLIATIAAEDRRSAARSAEETERTKLNIAGNADIKKPTPEDRFAEAYQKLISNPSFVTLELSQQQEQIDQARRVAGLPVESQAAVQAASKPAAERVIKGVTYRWDAASQKYVKAK